MNKKVRFLALLCAMLAVAVCAPLSAGAFLRDDLNLTDQQKAELKAIAAAARDDIAPYVEELKSLKADMEEIIVSNETIDTEEGSDACLLVDEMIRVRTQIMKIAARARLESANVLTIEQREIIIERGKERQERREERREECKERLDHLIEDID